MLEGVWLPIITPFKNDEVDYISYKRLIDYYIDQGINGIIPLGTTGESPVMSPEEFEIIIEKTIEYVNKRIPIYIGLGGNYTKKLLERLKIVEKYSVEGILSVCPYYNRPDQRGILEHFKTISQSTDRNIIIYNIPYRTGRNMENETIYKLAEHKNIVALKDACGNIHQTTELLLNPPKDFSLLTGEDAFFFFNLTLGGQGGIMASSHLHTKDFIEIYRKVKDNDHTGALLVWKKVSQFIPLLFKEPNPTPIKYALYKQGLIASPESRSPLLPITTDLEKKLELFL